MREELLWLWWLLVVDVVVGPRFGFIWVSFLSFRFSSFFSFFPFRYFLAKITLIASSKLSCFFSLSLVFLLSSSGPLLLALSLYLWAGMKILELFLVA
jgi:hypothetical protein